jgi:hypothetical protein
MRTALILLALISFTICDNSGIKIAITSDIFKILTKFDLNSLLQNKTIIDRAETSGKYLFNYDVVCENLWLTNVVQPDNVVIEQETTADGLPQVKVTLYNIDIAIQIAHLYVKYGLITENFYDAIGSASISYIEGRYHFTEDGKLDVSEFLVEIDDFNVDIRKDFLNWLIGLFKGLIKSKVTEALDTLGGTISDGVNNWVDGEFTYDLGYGIGLNFTNTLKPHLTQLYKNQPINKYGLKLAKLLFKDKEDLSETLTSVLTFGVHGSCYPNEHPELAPDFEPPKDMDFTREYLTNELQILISDYTLNTLLFIGQNNGYLHQEFTNDSHPLFPWNFTTEGLQTIIPQFGEKYPGKELQVEMKAYISALRHLRPYIVFSETGGKLVVNFNLDFLTSVSEDPLADPVEDLALNVTAELDFTVQVKYDLLTINWGELKVLNLDENANELNVPHDDLVTLVGKNWDAYVTKFIKGYTKNVALSAILTLVTGMEFKNFKLETKEGFLLASIATNLDK